MAGTVGVNDSVHDGARFQSLINFHDTVDKTKSIPSLASRPRFTRSSDTVVDGLLKFALHSLTSIVLTPWNSYPQLM